MQVGIALFMLVGLGAALLCGTVGLASSPWRPLERRERLIQRIDDVLPQTQCGQCGYHGCRPYAEALYQGAADIDQCPPGGTKTRRALADLLGRDAPWQPGSATHELHLARIVERDCIGCTKCIDACPVDAIVGAQRQMHTVIRSRCTGCALCIPPCPVDCIELEAESAEPDWRWPQPDLRA